MSLAYTAYSFIGSMLYTVLSPFGKLFAHVTHASLEDTGQRFGKYADTFRHHKAEGSRIWIHGASVGEMGVAESIVGALKVRLPNCSMIISAVTSHGKNQAMGAFSPNMPCVYAPLDFPQAVNGALTAMQPDALVCLETEIWPTWLISAHRRGIKTAIVNGRLSVRSIKGYLKIKALMQQTLDSIDRISMIHAADAERIVRLGAPESRVSVNGNAKYDLLLSKTDYRLRQNTLKAFNLMGNEPVFLAGSTRGNEEEIILEAYRSIAASIPGALLIIAPRHVHRIPAVEMLVRNKGFDYQLKTDLEKEGVQRSAPIVIINTIGDLPAIYSIAAVVFCGGSLVPLGGQNVMEGAVWGKPILYGPSMDDFVDAKALLENAGGGMTVKDGQDLFEKAAYYLSHPQDARMMGDKAKKAVMQHKGAAEKHAAVIAELLQP